MKKEPRWYLLWFLTSGMWGISFLVNLRDNKEIDFMLVMQFLNIVMSLAAGVLNANRYKKKQINDSKDNK